jgi:multidrug resistance efflux pump
MNRSIRIVRWGCGLGLAGLIVSLACARLGRGASTPQAETPAAGSAAEVHRVVCFGHVDVEGGVVGLCFTQAGRVAEVPVREGEDVAAGAVLVRLDDRLPRLRLAEAEAALASARSQLAQVRELPEQHRAKLAQQQAAVEAARFQVSAARHSLARKRKLAEAQQLNPEDVAVAVDQLAQLEALERAEQARRTEQERHDPLVEVRRAEAEVAVLEARLEQARHTLDQCSLRAPRAGRVVRVLVTPGDGVSGQPGQPAIQFCPDRTRLIRAEVEQEFAGRVAVGQAARVEDDVREGGRWRGRVVRLSDWYTQRRSPSLEPLQQNDVRTLECLIELEPGQAPVRLGQRVRVMLGEEGR